MCEDVSKHLDSDIIGFDIIQNKDTKEYFIMEANAASHFPTFSVISGVNIPSIIVDYIVKKIKQ
jgi:glutathione synthase/RimK-type ligase-like ATP-grasp enzyme